MLAVRKGSSDIMWNRSYAPQNKFHPRRIIYGARSRNNVKYCALKLRKYSKYLMKFGKGG